MLRRDGRGADDDLRAVRLEHVALVLGDLVGAHEDARVALALGDEREPDPRVARCRLDDDATRLEGPGLLGGLDHPQGDAVLHRPARVEVLHLPQHRGGDAVGDRVQLDERGVAHEVQDVLRILHRVILARLGGRPGGRKRGGADPLPCATMVTMDDYLDVNRANWDERAPAHARLTGLRRRPLRRRPRPPQRGRPLRPAAAGRRHRPARRPPAVPHRHRHPVAARLGGRMTGLDLSPGSLAEARSLAGAGRGARRLRRVRRVRRARGARRAPFDLVYTGIGALCWLPDIRRWAEVVGRPCSARRSAVPPRGPPDAVGARRAGPGGRLSV